MGHSCKLSALIQVGSDGTTNGRHAHTHTHTHIHQHRNKKHKRTEQQNQTNTTTDTITHTQRQCPDTFSSVAIVAQTRNNVRRDKNRFFVIEALWWPPIFNRGSKESPSRTECGVQHNRIHFGTSISFDAGCLQEGILRGHSSVNPPLMVCSRFQIVLLLPN